MQHLITQAEAIAIISDHLITTTDEPLSIPDLLSSVDSTWNSDSNDSSLAEEQLKEKRQKDLDTSFDTICQYLENIGINPNQIQPFRQSGIFRNNITINHPTDIDMRLFMNELVQYLSLIQTLNNAQQEELLERYPVGLLAWEHNCIEGERDRMQASVQKFHLEKMPLFNKELVESHLSLVQKAQQKTMHTLNQEFHIHASHGIHYLFGVHDPSKHFAKNAMMLMEAEVVFQEYSHYVENLNAELNERYATKYEKIKSILEDEYAIWSTVGKALEEVGLDQSEMADEVQDTFEMVWNKNKILESLDQNTVTSTSSLPLPESVFSIKTPEKIAVLLNSTRPADQKIGLELLLLMGHEGQTGSSSIQFLDCIYRLGRREESGQLNNPNFLDLGIKKLKNLDESLKDKVETVTARIDYHKNTAELADHIMFLEGYEPSTSLRSLIYGNASADNIIGAINDCPKPDELEPDELEMVWDNLPHIKLNPGHNDIIDALLHKENHLISPKKRDQLVDAAKHAAHNDKMDHLQLFEDLGIIDVTGTSLIEEALLATGPDHNLSGLELLSLHNIKSFARFITDHSLLLTDKNIDSTIYTCHSLISQGKLSDLKWFLDIIPAERHVELLSKVTLREHLNALHLAAYKKDNEIVEFLLKKGVNPDIIGVDGHSALLWAKDLQTIQSLINAGADCNIRSDNNAHILITAASLSEDLVKTLLDKRDPNGNRLIDPNVENDQGVTALMEAAASGNLACVEALVDAGADCSKKNSLGIHALSRAVMQGHEKIVRFFLEKDANGKPRIDPNETDIEEESPLKKAAMVGNITIIKDLIAAGADINAVDENKNTPLLFASLYGNIDAAKELVKAGAICDLENSRGNNALTMAVRFQYEELVTLFLEKEHIYFRRVNPHHQNHQGVSLLMEAAKTGNISIAQMILDHKVDYTTTDQNQSSALLEAISCDETQMALLLLNKYAADQMPITSDEALSLFSYALKNKNIEILTTLYAMSLKIDALTQQISIFKQAITSGDPDIFDLCWQQFINWENMQEEGLSDQHWQNLFLKAAESGNIHAINKITSLLDVNIVNSESLTQALSLATIGRHKEMVTFLLAESKNSPHQANPNQKNSDDNYPLIIAASNGDLEIVEKLIHAGADYNVKNADGTTALLAATQANKTEIARLLLEKDANNKPKANPDIADNTPDVPLLMALRNRNIMMMQDLLNAGANCSLEGSNALYYSIADGDSESALLMIRKIVKYGQEIDFDKIYIDHNNAETTFIELATRNNSPKIVKALVQAGAKCTYNSLRAAISENDLTLLKFFLGKDEKGQSRINPTSLKKFLTPALFNAIANNNLDAVKLLVEAGANTLSTSQGKTTIDSASSQSVEMLDFFLESDARQNLNNHQAQHIFNAIRSGKYENVEALINAGLEIDDQFKADLLTTAARQDDANILRLLLHNYAFNIDQFSEFSKSNALSAATKAGKLDNILILLEAGANIKTTFDHQETILHAAAQQDKQDVTRFILEKNLFDINQRDANGRTPLMSAALYNKAATMRLLIDNGADTSLKDNDTKTLLHYAAMSGRSTPPNPEALEFLLDRNELDINATDKDGNSPIHDSTESHNDDNFLLLLNSGANITLKNKNNDTLLHKAALSRNPDAIAKILETIPAENLAEAINAQNKKGETPLLCVIRSQILRENITIPILNRLREAGADFSLADNLGNNALHYAIENRHSIDADGDAIFDLVDLLTQKDENGVRLIDPDLRNKAHQTPLATANDSKLEATLLSNGCYHIELHKDSKSDISAKAYIGLIEFKQIAKTITELAAKSKLTSFTLPHTSDAAKDKLDEASKEIYYQLLDVYDRDIGELKEDLGLHTEAKMGGMVLKSNPIMRRLGEQVATYIDLKDAVGIHLPGTKSYIIDTESIKNIFSNKEAIQTTSDRQH